VTARGGCPPGGGRRGTGQGAPTPSATAAVSSPAGIAVTVPLMNTPLTSPTVLRRALVGLGTVAVLAVGALAATFGSSVEVLADGELHGVRLTTGTVADALEAADIELDDADDVHPDLDTEIDGDTRVVVTRAITVDVVVDDATTTVTAPVRSVDGAVRAAGLDHLRLEGAVATPGWHDAVADGDRITIQRPVEVTLEVDGEQHSVITLAAEVSDLLRLQDVELGPDDLVRPALSAQLDDDGTITVQRVERREDVVEVLLEREEIRRDDSTLDRGQTRVEQEGRDGLRLDTYAVTLVDGEETERERLDREVVTEPVDRIVRVGTRSTLPAAPSGVPGINDPVWTRLAQCESNNNWQAVSANGLYYGGLQFHPQTWRSVGGSGLPNEASRDEQIRRAQILLARSGWGQWPACTRMLGLR
jgi:resuscitation-promoting factor RpfB